MSVSTPGTLYYYSPETSGFLTLCEETRGRPKVGTLLDFTGRTKKHPPLCRIFPTIPTLEEGSRVERRGVGLIYRPHLTPVSPTFSV